MKTRPVELSAAAVEGFVEHYLRENYSESAPIGNHHREWWEMCCDPHPRVAIAAPRKHSKTTSINIGYSLATALGRQHQFQIKVSRSRPIAIEFLRTVKSIISGNERIVKDFRFRGFSLDTVDDFIAVFGDGYEIRMVALGCEQPMRGFTWDTRRASLIICDDLEDDEQVMNADRRKKTMDWFTGALMPIGSQDSKLRVIGTFLHHQSLLKVLTEASSWKSKVYEAHNDDFSEVLWPEMMPEEKLREIQQSYIDLGNLIQYNMEYRNQTFDYSTGYFIPEDFIELEQEQREQPHTFYVGVDPAISNASGRDRTSFVIAGLDPAGFLDIFEERGGRWDGNKIIEQFFLINDTYKPDQFFVESGSILKSLLPALEMEQRRYGRFLNIKPMVPIKNKSERAKSIQSRMRAKAVRWDKATRWYPQMELEMLNFRGEDEQNDRVDALAWIGMGLSSMVMPLTEEQFEEEKIVREEHAFMDFGRDEVVGY